uniref:Uncharacterized protein n=1 Tax=Ackermannviridae sp. ctaCq7 TaxID=2827294 RepID=A0A8S5R5G7_9CAUD|nr:MAG TPA: hypothetical protein [Ackermannviridae sp. ctaCq7]
MLANYLITCCLKPLTNLQGKSVSLQLPQPKVLM